YMNNHNAKSDARNKSWLGHFFPIKRLQTIEEARKEMDRLYAKTYNHEWDYGDNRYSYDSGYAWQELGEIHKIINSCRMASDGKIYLSQEGVSIIGRDYSD
ncbi:MAG: hypothetical protein M0R48_11950, partial [Candidatus Omnitrophica bacterium]|nr:hypothetical protein [Candidatus Omnitrophota bacterium]